MKVCIELKEEGGITNHSLFNAKVLMLAHGNIRTITLNGDPQHCDYRTTVEFEDGFHFEFTGFSWGYGGEGPCGLIGLIGMVGVMGDWTDEIYNLKGEQKDYKLL